MPFKPVANAPTLEEVKKARLDHFKGKNPTIQEMLDLDCAPKTKKALNFLLKSTSDTYHSERNAMVTALCDAVKEDLNKIR